jgi:hypothetical protein
VFERTGASRPWSTRCIAETAEGVTVIPRNELRPIASEADRAAVAADAGRGGRPVAERRSDAAPDPPPSIRNRRFGTRPGGT